MVVSQLVMIEDDLNKDFLEYEVGPTIFWPSARFFFSPFECLFDLLYFFLSFGCILNHIKNGPKEQRNET